MNRRMWSIVPVAFTFAVTPACGSSLQCGAGTVENNGFCVAASDGGSEASVAVDASTDAPGTPDAPDAPFVETACGTLKPLSAPHQLVLDVLKYPSLTTASAGFALASKDGAQNLVFEALDPTGALVAASRTTVVSTPPDADVILPILVSTSGGFQGIWSAPTGSATVTNIPYAGLLSQNGALISAKPINSTESGTLGWAPAATRVGNDLFATVVQAYPTQVARVVRIDSSLGLQTTDVLSPSTGSNLQITGAIGLLDTGVVAVFAVRSIATSQATATAFQLDASNQLRGSGTTLKQLPPLVDRATESTPSMAIGSSGQAALWAWSEAGNASNPSLPAFIDLALLTTNGSHALVVTNLPQLSTRSVAESVQVLWTGANFWVLWEDQDGVYASAIDTAGKPLGNTQTLAQGVYGVPSTGVSAVWLDGTLTVVWAVKTIVTGTLTAPVPWVGRFACGP
jgi:hypothetical protein